MATRVKVVCNFKSPKITGVPVNLIFSPVYSGSEENKRFYAATPGGTFSFYIVNSETAEQFQMGKEYYFDIFAADSVPQVPTGKANADPQALAG